MLPGERFHLLDEDIHLVRRGADEAVAFGEDGLEDFFAEPEPAVAREPAELEKDALTQQLSRLFGKRVVPHISLNPGILGGVIVKVGDTVMDGSVRRRLASLRQRMLSTVAR